jgi:hypothetical protein
MTQNEMDQLGNSSKKSERKDCGKIRENGYFTSIDPECRVNQDLCDKV